MHFSAVSSMMYSISVTARSKRLRDEMYEFLQRMYRPWAEVIDDDDDGFFSGPLVDQDLGDSSGLRIGFEYQAGEAPEREYHFALMRWMAQQVGKRRAHFRIEGTLPQAVPFVVFDGIETLPIFVEGEWTADGGVPGQLVDAVGLYLDDHVARELAWLYLPFGTFIKVNSHQHHGDPEAIKEALIHEGLDGAYCCLSIIREQVVQLADLWATRGKPGT